MAASAASPGRHWSSRPLRSPSRDLPSRRGWRAPSPAPPSGGSIASRTRGPTSSMTRARPWPRILRLRTSTFAQTLRAIAEEGSTPFYSGAIGEAIVAAVNGAEGNPGGMTMADLAGLRGGFPRPGLRHLPRGRGLRHGPAVLGRAHGRADPGPARPCRHGELRAHAGRRASLPGGRQARLRRPGALHGGCRFRQCADQGAARSDLSHAPRPGDQPKPGDGAGRSRQSALA